MVLLRRVQSVQQFPNTRIIWTQQYRLLAGFEGLLLGTAPHGLLSGVQVSLKLCFPPA